MTLVGKIFTVLIFVMSIVFFAFSMMVFATHRNWKEYATNPTAAAGKPLGLQIQLDNQKQINRDAEATIQRLRDELKNEQAARTTALAALFARYSRTQMELATKEQELQSLRATHAQVARAAEEAQNRLTALETEVTGIRDDYRTTKEDLDAKLLQVIKLTDELNQAIALRNLEQEKNTQAVLQIAQMKSVLDANGLSATSLVSHIPPAVDGVVLEVGEKDLIEISIGKDDGLKEGHSLEVYRNNTYLGRIVIRRTAPDRAVGQVIKELQRGQIKRGDRVSTKLG
ncbi:MAG: hypothetical protein MUF06_00740 [Pirellulaceae bacterium]|jgi:hypothetical protein|nr:hypothetical protein [Pirellulaceae bacterium]